MDVGATSSTASTTGSNASERDFTDALGGLDLGDFFDLMIKEMQNQDPLNPQDSDKILQQFSQLREIGATDKLNETLDSVLLGQQLANASSLVNKDIIGLSDDASNVEGRVDRVTIEKGLAKLHIGDKKVSITNVREILANQEATDSE